MATSGKRKHVAPKSRGRKKARTRASGASKDLDQQATASEVLTRMVRNAVATDSPIADPLKEKELIEKHGLEGWFTYLRKRTGCSALVMHPDVLRTRVCEVYRLCYEKAVISNLEVISDFVAYHPQLVLRSPWLAALLTPLSLASFEDQRSGKNRLLQALAYGFRRAAAPKAQRNRAFRATRLLAAHDFLPEIRNELDGFVVSLSVPQAERRWVAEQVAQKLPELQRRFPPISPVSDRIEKLLLRGQVYKASIAIAAKVFHVRVRDLQTKPPEQQRKH